MTDSPKIKPCDSPEEMEKSIKAWSAPTTAGFVIAALWIVFCYFSSQSVPVWALWLGSILVFGGVGVLISLSVTNRWCGIFINERKLMSISRVQVGLWTLILLSAFFAIFIGRLRAGDADPLNIVIQPELWAVMGISGASFVGRSVIAGNKSSTEPLNSGKEVDKVQRDLKDPDESADQIEYNRVGVLYANNCIKSARLMDMFEGDELRNTRFVDVGKLQMFFFTVIVLMSYSVALFSLMATSKASDITMFPALSDGLVALLGISHAGMLGTSAVTATPVAPK
jgi:hypothetical protein